MKSIKDAITLYRTLAAEALSEFSYSERGESLGRRIDDAAWRLSAKVRPPREDALPAGLWQNVGWMDETGIDLGALIKEVDRHSADFARHYLDNIEASISVGPTSADVITALFKPTEDRAARQMQEMHDAIAPALAKLGEGKVEWSVPEIRTAEMREIYAFPKFDLPKFADFSATANEIYGPEFSRMQDMINDMVRRHSREHEWDFLREVEEATGFRHGLSDLPATVEDNPTT
jgi:hypothetical protein